MVEPDGIEPTTSCLQSRLNLQLFRWNPWKTAVFAINVGSTVSQHTPEKGTVSQEVWLAKKTKTL